MGQDVRQLGVAEQGLGGDAADVEADTSPVLLLDHADLEAELGGADGGDVATGARTEDDDIEITHGPSLFLRASRTTTSVSRYIGPTQPDTDVRRWSHALPDRRLLRLPRHPAAERLRASGHHVTALVRRPPGPHEVRWDPYTAALGPEVVDSHDVVVNLAGSPTAGNPHSKKWATS